jgi:membrane protease YdiL (CAAX protease family)
MFIEQVYTRKFSFALYLPVPLVFIAIMALNYLAVVMLNLDVEAVMKSQIEQKGELRVFFEILIPFAIFLALLLIWVKFVHKQTITSLTTGRKKTDWKRIAFAFALWGGITTALILAACYAEPENYIFNFKPVPFAALAAMSVIMIPVQTSFEEYLFRGYLMQGIGVAAKSRLVPLLVTSLMFGLLHIANPEVGKVGYIILVYYIGTGLFLGIVTLMDDGMELALGFHAANNLIGALLITSDWSAFQTPSIFKDKSLPAAGYDVLLPVLIIYPLLLFIFSKKYSWTAWKDKLTGKVQPLENNIQSTSHDYQS